MLRTNREARKVETTKEGEGYQSKGLLVEVTVLADHDAAHLAQQVQVLPLHVHVALCGEGAFNTRVELARQTGNDVTVHRFGPTLVAHHVTVLRRGSTVHGRLDVS
jgi:hypothetical protein